MAFEGLSEKLTSVFRKLTSRGKLSEKDIKEAMREVRMALLEADVNFLVVKDFVKKVSERAVGEEILNSLTPGQQVVKIVNDELTQLLGGTQSKLEFAANPPTVFLLVGLQGAGKTTMAAKLAGHLKSQGRKPLLVACDIYRPAAIQQLQVVAEKVGTPVFEMGQTPPLEIVRAAKKHAQHYLNDVMIVDTAGRLHIDEALMGELRSLRDELHPQEILLVIDAMAGQDAVTVADTFNKELGVSGVILTKLDGDTRGGAAISVKSVTGKPIKFAGVGEKVTDLEPFYPDRMASRILGMGDVLTLIEKAQSAFDESSAKEIEKKMRTATFTLEDFLEQFQQVRKLGDMSEILSMIPGMGGRASEINVDEKLMRQTEAIIRSMTPEERKSPQILNAGRKKRIAKGSGTSIQQINQLLKQFEQGRQMMKQLAEVTRGRGRKKGRFRMPL